LLIVFFIQMYSIRAAPGMSFPPVADKVDGRLRLFFWLVLQTL
jgi:hypothetical protein